MLGNVALAVVASIVAGDDVLMLVLPPLILTVLSYTISFPGCRPFETFQWAGAALTLNEEDCQFVNVVINLELHSVYYTLFTAHLFVRRLTFAVS